jgi:uncharacterized membrane protein
VHHVRDCYATARLRGGHHWTIRRLCQPNAASRDPSEITQHCAKKVVSMSAAARKLFAALEHPMKLR